MTVAAARNDASYANFREAGYWLDKTVDQLLTEAVARTPDKVAIVADRADREQAPRFTYKELEKLADRAASSLVRLGVRRGDVVTVQLPNWWEFVVTAFACSKIGAVMNPVMPILRARAALHPELLPDEGLHCAEDLSRIRLRRDGAGHAGRPAAPQARDRCRRRG